MLVLRIIQLAVKRISKDEVKICKDEVKICKDVLRRVWQNLS